MSNLHPFRLHANSPLVPRVLDLVQGAFAYMEPRIDPPSSMHALTDEKIRQQCATGEVWAIGQGPDACVFLGFRDVSVYVGKLAVRNEMRGRGLARRLICVAERRAQDLGLSVLELETRIELTENHATSERLGFEIVGDGAHDGYDRPTFVIMRKPIP